MITNLMFSKFCIFLFAHTVVQSLIVGTLFTAFNVVVAYSPTDKSPFRRSEILDRQGKYLLEWNVNWIDKTITFNVTVHTTGYVGFGLSKKGKMAGADIVIGGVLSDGSLYFSDQHAVANQVPSVDKRQDWTLHSAWENTTHTFLSFSRPFETCDDDHDLPIQDDVITLIWSFGESDNANEYHFNNRGQFYVYLLDPDLTPQKVHDAQQNNEKLTKLGNWNVWSISMKQTLLAQDTSYMCTFHKAPSRHSKQHIVGFRTILESDLERRHIHHYLLHRCYPPKGQDAQSFFEQYVDRPAEECYVLNLPSRIPTEYCRDVTHEWAVGATPIFFPEHVGVPLSESPDEYYMFQVHYDNPQSIPGIELNFGLEMFYTENLRKNDVGLMFVGATTPGSPSIMLPSHSIGHVLYGHCGGGCTRKMFPPEGIQVFAAKLHTHLAGIGTRIIHVRGNTELPNLLNDDNFMFDYQPARVLREERTILPGDSIIKRCVYDTRDRNGTATIGSFSTHSEMCNGFLWYYPYVRTSGIYGACSSVIRSNEYRDFLQIRSTTWSNEQLDYIVTSPPQNAGLTTREVGTSIEWTTEKRNQLQKYHKHLPQITSCPDLGPDAVEKSTSVIINTPLTSRRFSKHQIQRGGSPNNDHNEKPDLNKNEFISIYSEDDITPYERPSSSCSKYS